MCELRCAFCMVLQSSGTGDMLPKVGGGFWWVPAVIQPEVGTCQSHVPGPRQKVAKIDVCTVEEWFGLFQVEN